MGASRCWIAPACLALAGCLSEVGVPLPELGDARALVVVVASRGQVRARAVALPFAGPLPLAAQQEGDFALFTLLYDQTLEELRLVEGEIEVVPAETCGRRLPAPSRAWSLARDRSWTTPEVVPGLRVGLTPGACPRVVADGALSIDVRCASSPCHARLEQTECRVVIDFGDCPLGVLRGGVGGLGELCFEPSAQLGTCEEGSPISGAARSIRCAGGEASSVCLADLYAPRSAPLFRVDEVAVVEPVSNPSAGDDLGRPPWGALLDLAVRDGRVAVIGQQGLGQWLCTTERRSFLHVLDAETLDLVSTATVPPCAVAIAPDPTSEGYLLAAGGVHPTLARLDRAGRVVATAAWSRATASPLLAPTSLVTRGAPRPLAIVALAEAVNDSRGPSWLFEVDLATFTPVAVPNPSGVSLRQLAPWRAEEILGVDDVWDGIRIVDLATGLSHEGPSLAGTLSNANPCQALWHGPSSRFVLSEAGVNAGVYTFLETFERAGRAGVYERDAVSWALAPWPADPRLVIVGMTDRAEPRAAVIALLDPSTPRFLPGAQAVGRGSTGALRADDRGHVFTVLPWTGRLLRISSAP